MFRSLRIRVLCGFWMLISSVAGIALTFPSDPLQLTPADQISAEEEILAPECTWQPGFHGEGLQFWVWDTVVWNDGTGAAVYVAGAFRSADGIVVNHIAKWNGAHWSGLGTGMNAPVRSLEVWNDGSGPALYAGGEFTMAGGVSANHMAKWNGTTWSPVGVGMNGAVLDLVVHNDGSGAALFAGGTFTAAGGATANRVAKWNGTNWSSLGSGTANGMNSTVWGLDSFNLGSGSALYVVGEFTFAGGNVASRIAKWDGNTFSSLGAGFDNMAFDLTTFNDGSGQALYVVGHFTASGSTSVSRIAKWNGVAWSAVGGGLNGTGYGLIVHDDGNGPALYVGGGFSLAGSVSVSNVARWNGSFWSPLGTGVNSWVRKFATFDDGGGQALFVLGGFTKAGPQQARYAARWRNQTWSDLTGGSGKGMDASIWALASFNGSLYAGGEFSEAGGVPAKSIARFNGSTWSEPGGGMNNVVHTLATFNDGSGLALYAGGGFTVAGGVQASRVARFNGSTWSPVGLGLNSHVYKLRVLDDGTGPALYAAGHFSFSGSGGGVAKWNGANWTFLGSGFNNAVRAIEVFDDGTGPRLYAGGHFTEADGHPARYMAMWNGSTWQALPSEPNGVVYELKTTDDGNGTRLFAGGDFTQVGTQPIARFAKWNGAAWASVDGGFGMNGFVYAIENLDVGDGRGLFVGGGFSMVSGATFASIAKRQASTWTALDYGVSGGSVLAIASHDSGSGLALFAGGYFTWVGSYPGFYIAKYTCNTLPASTDLRVSKTDGVSTVSAGANLVYTIVATNSGSTTDPAATLTDTPPSTLSCSYSSVSTGGASRSPSSGNGAINATLNLPPGSSVTYTMSCALSGTATGSVTNTATLAASIVDNDPSNNTASDTDQISSNLPNLRIPDELMTAEGATVDVPVIFSPNGHNIAGIGLSIDYDEVCLDPDINNDGILDHVVFLNSGFSNSVAFNRADTDGEIDISVADVSPPFAALPAGDLVRIRFTAICAAGSTPRAARVGFSTAPPPSFSNTAGVSVAGTHTDGRVWILSGLRGDCNGDGVVNVADLVSIAYEIFDGDGDFWLHAPLPTYPGSPAGCDANANTWIQASDLTCANLLIFGGTCGSPLALTPVVPPMLEVSNHLDGQMVWLRASLTRNGNGVGSLAFSLDLDPLKYDLSRVDADGDGRPDHVRFPNGEPNMVHLGWDVLDLDGELDILLADLGQQTLHEGVLVEIGIPASSLPNHSVRYSGNPVPSFGQLTGGALPGIPVLGSVLFLDGFESGDMSAWDIVVP